MSPTSRPPISDFGLWTLILALIGFWSPWLTHPAAALHINGFELAEWVTFLPGVRDGALRLGRLSFLIPLACLALLLGITASRFRSRARLRRPRWQALLPDSLLGWGLLLIGLLCSAAVFPPYPYLLTAYADPEFRLQFVVAGATCVGLLAVLLLPDEVNNNLQILLALGGGGFGLWTLLALWPVASELLRTPWAIGYGWFAMLVGFTGLFLSGVGRVFGLRD